MFKADEYPQDYFLELENNEFFIGRITINFVDNMFTTEIDIVQKESKKIFRHVGILYRLRDKDEAIDRSVQFLSDFLRKI